MLLKTAASWHTYMLHVIPSPCVSAGPVDIVTVILVTGLLYMANVEWVCRSKSLISWLWVNQKGDYFCGPDLISKLFKNRLQSFLRLEIQSGRAILLLALRKQTAMFCAGEGLLYGRWPLGVEGPSFTTARNIILSKPVNLKSGASASFRSYPSEIPSRKA